MDDANFWQTLAIIGFAGFGVGVGLVVGVAAARLFRRYISEDKEKDDA